MGKGGHPTIHNTKICYGFFHTGFCSTVLSNVCQLSLPAGLLITIIQLTQVTAHIHGSIVAGSDKHCETK